MAEQTNLPNKNGNQNRKSSNYKKGKITITNSKQIMLKQMLMVIILLSPTYG